MKKVKGALGVIGAGLLGGLTALNPLPTQINNSQESNTVTQNTQSKKESTPLQQQSSIRVTPTPQFIGGMAMHGWRESYGIPPDIYGMYHVRRGTHKRSNKSTM